MRGKIVFITGASSGIGEGCARKFASQGSDLILNARNVAKLEELKNELEATYGVRVFLLPFDVRDRKAATQALADLLSAIVIIPLFFYGQKVIRMASEGKIEVKQKRH